jgi:hypothetical protein
MKRTVFVACLLPAIWALLVTSCALPNGGTVNVEHPGMVVHVEVSDYTTGVPLAATVRYWFKGTESDAATCTTYADGAAPFRVTEVGEVVPAAGTCSFIVPVSTTDSHMWVSAEGYLAQDRHITAGPGIVVKWLMSKPPPPLVLPGRAETLSNLRADICMRADGDTSNYPADKPGSWEVLGKTDAEWEAWASRYAAAGHRLVIASIRVNGYLGTTFDLSTDLPLLQRRLDRAIAAGLVVMPDVTFWDEGQAVDWAKYETVLRAIKGHAPAAFFGWEITVDGGPSLWPSGADLLRGIRLARDILGPEIVLGVEFNAHGDGRDEPIVFDGRAASSSQAYYTQTDAREIDVILLRLPYALTDNWDRAAFHVGGVLCRLQGRFDRPVRYPDGRPIPESVRDNWNADYGLGKRVVVFEYASYLRYPSSRKRALRLYLQSLFPTLAGYGEGRP